MGAWGGTCSSYVSAYINGIHATFESMVSATNKACDGFTGRRTISMVAGDGFWQLLAGDVTRYCRQVSGRSG